MMNDNSIILLHIKCQNAICDENEVEDILMNWEYKERFSMKSPTKNL